MKSNIMRLISTFTVLIVVAFLFVWWMSSSDFENSYREIKQQYYGVLQEQVVNEVETSIKYGKKLDSFYDINSIFGKLTTLLPSHVKAVITGDKGEVLYTSFDSSADKNDYLAVFQNPHVRAKVENLSNAKQYTSLAQDKYEIMMLPISDKSQTVVGSFCLVYPSAEISKELKTERIDNLKISFLVLIITILLLIVILNFIHNLEKKENPEDHGNLNILRLKRKQLMIMVPSLIIMAGIGVQSTIMYNQYQVKYKNVLTESARGILTYVDSSITSLHQKGVSYDKMQGMTEYLATKVKDTPILWNIRVSNAIADTGEVLNRENAWVISASLEPEANKEIVQLEIQISQEYLDSKMLNMLLQFLATLIVATVIVFEVMRLPDILIFRGSRLFNTSSPEQYETITASLRILSFLAFMGMYASMPFSAILMRKWDAQIFGLSTDITASLPMTLELLTLMLFSMLFARFFNRAGLKTFIFAAGFFIILGNALCTIASGPIQLILFRGICGIGFAGLKHVLNTVISLGSEGSERTGLNIAGMNAGLLGGIMCGGSIGAVITNSIGMSFTYLFTAGILFVCIIMILFTIPWKLLRQNVKDNSEREEFGFWETFHVLFNVKVLKYLFMVTLPLNLGLMFIVAFIPGYIQKMNLPVILISYGYLFNGLVGIYLGAFLAKKLAKKLGRALCVSVMLFIGGLGILIIGIWSSVGIILLSTALMGLFDGFGSPVAMNYFIEIPEIKNNVGVTNSLAFLGVVGNAIQMISPLVYGWMMLIPAVSGLNSLVILGAVFLVFAFSFLFPFRGQTPKQKISV
ncbi:MAG: MFS transporter [Desulfosporosinus sp.]|jgi:MFS family permease